MRRPNEEEWIHLVDDGDVEGREEWMDGVKAVFKYFAERTPGSYIEKQEYMCLWMRLWEFLFFFAVLISCKNMFNNLIFLQFNSRWISISKLIISIQAKFNVQSYFSFQKNTCLWLIFWISAQGIVGVGTTPSSTLGPHRLERSWSTCGLGPWWTAKRRWWWGTGPSRYGHTLAPEEPVWRSCWDTRKKGWVGKMGTSFFGVFFGCFREDARLFSRSVCLRWWTYGLVQRITPHYHWGDVRRRFPLQL